MGGGVCVCVRCSVLHDDVTGNGLMQCSTGPSLPNPRPRVTGEDSKNNTRDNNAPLNMDSFLIWA